MLQCRKHGARRSVGRLRNETQVDDAGRWRQAAVENQLTLISVKGEQPSFLFACNGQHLRVAGPAHARSNCFHVESLRAQRKDARARDVLIGQ
jgi:hypothetical protein